MRTTVNIDDELLAAVKVLAAQSHRTIGSVLEDALRKLIDEQVPGAREEFALPEIVGRRPGLQPGVDLFDREEIAELQGDNALR